MPKILTQFHGIIPVIPNHHTFVVVVEMGH
jgi:hypothetical protein